MITFYRAIVIQAVHDFGSGEMKPDEFDVVDSEHFIEICGFADFDHGWIKKIFNSLSEERPEVRAKITRDVVRLMKHVPTKEKNSP